jgi:hypothetical protein
MSAPIPDSLEQQLAAADAATRSERAERLQRLQAEGEPPMGRLFPGGQEAAVAFNEAAFAYVSGIYLGCILLVQTCLEHNLGGMFILEGRDETARLPYHRMLVEARDARILTQDEHELFDRLRRGRNPYAHPRSIQHPTALMRRAIDTRTPPEDFLEADALDALLALVQLVNRPPFGLYH